MGKKKLTKKIREIAKRLPPVKEQHASGYVIGEDNKPTPHLYLTDYNHARRLRRAYVRHGMEGIHSYLNSIHQLQIKRNEQLSKESIQNIENDVLLRDEQLDLQVPNTENNN